MRTGPNCGSLDMPRMISVPGAAMAWTETPWMLAEGTACLAAATISS